MNSSPATIIARVLTNAGLGSTVSDDGVPSGDWPVYSSEEPDSPDSAVTVYDTEGTAYCRDFLTGNVVGPTGLQVRVRSAAKAGAWDKAVAVYDYLSKTLYRRGVSIDGRYYVVHACEQFGDITDLGKESPSSHRHLVVFNVQVEINDRTP